MANQSQRRTADPAGERPLTEPREERPIRTPEGEAWPAERTVDRPVTEPVADGRSVTEPVAGGRNVTGARRAQDGRDADTGAGRDTGNLAMPRTRGAATGLIVLLLGIWGAIVPFVGPYFHYAYINYSGFSLPNMGRIWLDVLPGVLAILAGAELIRSANRPTAALAAIAAGVAGGWFVIGPTVSLLWNHGISQTGLPLGGTVLRTIEPLGYYYVLGAVILWLAAVAFGRFSVRTVRDEQALGRERR